jgi:hypothetical protein
MQDTCNGCTSFGRNCTIKYVEKDDECPCQFCIVKVCCITTMDTCLPFNDLLSKCHDIAGGRKYE